MTPSAHSVNCVPFVECVCVFLFLHAGGFNNWSIKQPIAVSHNAQDFNWVVNYFYGIYFFLIASLQWKASVRHLKPGIFVANQLISFFHAWNMLIPVRPFFSCWRRHRRLLGYGARLSLEKKKKKKHIPACCFALSCTFQTNMSPGRQNKSSNKAPGLWEASYFFFFFYQSGLARSDNFVRVSARIRFSKLWFICATYMTALFQLLANICMMN